MEKKYVVLRKDNRDTRRGFCVAFTCISFAACIREKLVGESGGDGSRDGCTRQWTVRLLVLLCGRCLGRNVRRTNK